MLRFGYNLGSVITGRVFVYNIVYVFHQFSTINQVNLKLKIIGSEPEFNALFNGIISFKLRIFFPSENDSDASSSVSY